MAGWRAAIVRHGALTLAEPERIDKPRDAGAPNERRTSARRASIAGPIDERRRLTRRLLHDRAHPAGARRLGPGRGNEV